MMRLPSLLLCLFLCLPCLILPCRAMVPPETSGVMETTEPETAGEAAEPIVLTQLTEYETNSNWPYINCLILLGPEDSLADVLTGADYQYAGYTDTDGEIHRVPIQWDLSDGSLSQPGLHILRAAPVPEAGMVLAEGFDGIVSWPMYRRGGGEPVEVIPLYGLTITDALIAQGSTDPLSELTIVTKNKRCALWENGWWNTTSEILWTWDASKLDTGLTGRQTLPGTITGTPEWITIPEEHRDDEVTVFVLPPDRIELYAPTNLSRNGILTFEWIYSTETVSGVLLQSRDESGRWTDCDADWYNYRNASLFSNGYFQLRLLDIPPGAYTFRLAYQDSASGEALQKYTEPLTLTIPDDMAALIPGDGKVPEKLDIGGDRDGGDSEGEDLPDYSQPAPVYPEEEPAPTQPPAEETGPAAALRPTAAPAPAETTESPALEWVTDSFTDISGIRLAVLTELGDTVLFEKEGISVEIPSGLLKDLALEDFDLLEVVILRPEYDRLRLSVLKNGVPVTDLTGTAVYIPWEGEVPAECREESGIPVPVTAEGDLLRLSVDGPGAYCLLFPEEPAIPAETEVLVPAKTETASAGMVPEKATPGPVLVLFPVLIVLLILAVIALWRRLRHE